MRLEEINRGGDGAVASIPARRGQAAQKPMRAGISRSQGGGLSLFRQSQQDKMGERHKVAARKARGLNDLSQEPGLQTLV